MIDRGHLYTEGVEVLPVKAFRLEPILTGGRHPGNLTVDGELVRTETIQVGDRKYSVNLKIFHNLLSPPTRPLSCVEWFELSAETHHDT